MIISDVKMVTMTIGYILSKYINLNIIYNYLDLDDVIIGLKYNNCAKGEIKIKKPYKKLQLKAKMKPKNDFKNQCTLIMFIKWTMDDKTEYSKNLNVKLFNNGKIIITGCTCNQQIIIAINYLIDKLHGMVGPLDTIYKNLRSLNNRESILNFKIIEYLIEKTGKTALNDSKSKTKREKKSINYLYKDLTDTDDKTIYNLYLLIKIYFSDYDIKNDNINIYNFITDVLLKEDRVIYPIYYNPDEKLEFDATKIDILNINSRLNCSCSLNRNSIYKLLKADPAIDNVLYDENLYPGVKAFYKNTSKPVKINNNKKKNKLTIIFFNSGKINITSTQTHEQTIEIYNFIKIFCNKYYDEICIENTKDILYKKYIESLQKSIKIIDDDITYVFLKRDHIMSNKRNKLILQKYK